MKHIIIGNGPTGLVAAETLRRLQPDAEIALIGDEAEPPYSRMAIPYFLHGGIAAEGTHLRKEHDHYARHGIHLIRGRVVKIDRAAKQIEFDGGERLPYDRLLIATGSHPVRPPVPGMDLPNVHTCWTLDDARAIAAKARPGARVLQLGAGFIGCIIMESLAARGVKLTVVEMGDRMVPRMMTAKAGAMIKQWVEKKGVAVHVNSAITAIEQKGGELAVKLDTGATLAADLVICAAGVRPNIGFLAGSGIEIGRGIHVDSHMHTSVPDIYAAGDVTEAPGFHSGQPELNAIQPNAADQARIAAHNMAGEASVSQGSLAINVLDTLGLISTSFGHWPGLPKDEGGSGVELFDEAANRYLSLQFKHDVLIGATSIGWTDHVGALRGLIQTRASLGAWKDRLLDDPTSFMTAYLATAQKAA
ncbi:NAD(P)/FAD-dependent oxidoreductase [Sulfurisoma sediminicola]|uniref:Pyridine nucleotide-disulfide oxidoreductase n=1 Tax=Sulfurisoma sediminicola TaxID=1381557 RepID=A0A497XET7_9PROT|nr:FAD-dependent oxidoreductase [Sulfurisoma sediminicola]RLJ65196.1 pyridine nucleotide-disulfide oxidoreductase [Sulfurisoma sediminicola]